jgi:AraC-like DNA-binding protein/quercetin dioxygenase-like cupin family protein
MIQHLNPMTFQAYGTLLPERPDSTESTGKGDHVRRIALPHGELPVYRTLSDTWLYSHNAMTVLAVRRGDEEYRHFYLDKPVSLRRNVIFCLIPMGKETTAEMAYVRAPEVIDRSSWNSSLEIIRRLKVESLYTFFYQEKEQGFIFPGEAHPMPELTYVDQGSLHSVVDGQDLLLEQGDVMVYTPDQWHMQYADMGVAPRFVTISFGLSGGDLERIKNRKFKAPQQAVTLLQQMLREQENPDNHSGDMIISMLNQLLVILLRQVDAPATKVKTSNAVHSENEIIRRTQQYISEHIREKLTVPSVAENVDVSPSYLTALFHKNLQISPGEYIRRVKLQESKQMIRENSMTFTEIAAALQYSTVHHFSRQFKEKFGITPTEYAKSVR